MASKRCTSANDRRRPSLLDLTHLLAYLDDAFEADGCDNTHRFTREFLGSRGFHVEATLRWLERRGGYCDCEVLMNVAYPASTQV